MTQARGQFSSKIGFLMAAAGSAVGLGNIWGFPTQAANNGGAAFVLVYLVLAFVVAYPALMAEITLGRYARSNIVTALGGLSPTPWKRWAGWITGGMGLLVASLILGFYTIVAGWMLGAFIEPGASLIGADALGQWFVTDGFTRNLLLCFVFSAFCAWVIARGIEQGIEAWCTRLMPLLAAILIGLIVYVLQQPGASDGLRTYLIPDFSRITDPDLLLGAMGQAFFSLSLGAGAMLIYGSYLKRDDSLPRLGVEVTLLDTSIAFIAGLLVIPAMYVAQAQGATIFGEDGNLLAGPALIFQVLPSLFDGMGAAGPWVALAFFALMTIAALTSAISMLEVPVATLTEITGRPRTLITPLVSLAIFGLSTLLIFNMDALFDLTIVVATRFGQPLLGLALCLFAGWVLHRDKLLEEMREGHPGIERTLFWKIWPVYVRVICPLLILAVFVQSLR
ncbi:sodium-dependent transporter [Marinimicrobium alkaliphilum]|uniref:sodium-dependent transporter n=1 Tax=Marinimicrobium alkaliphilum TaxID=2202654 RepID=UPI000DB9D9C3|nr:sodium-dependent transporter [Marinimicrobium alkaliphilum]